MEKIYFYEDHLQEREIFVDDSCLGKKKKISLSQVKKICSPALRSKGYTVGKGDLQWLTFSNGCPFETAYQVNKTCSGLCLFTLDCSKGGEKFLAVYAPYGKLVHVLKENEYELVEKAFEQRVQLNVAFFFDEDSVKEISKEVILAARVAQVKRNLFGTPCLKLLKDRIIRKTVGIKEKDAFDSFSRGFLLSEKITDEKLFKFTGSLLNSKK